MKIKVKYVVITVALILITLSLFNKYNELKNIKLDGDGIGIYYFPIVHNERVLNEEVPAYANRFLFAANTSLVSTIISIFLGLNEYLRSRKKY
jgi:hypothetical protein